MSQALVGILLAAGASRRFGSNKLLHPMPNGDPMAVCAARTLIRALPHSLAVVSSLDGELAKRLHAEGLELVLNPHAQHGIGSSIASGCAARPKGAGWIITLADMPYLRTTSIQAVANALTSGALLAAPSYQGRRGHPVGFSSPLLAELISLGQDQERDQGARGIVQRYSDQTQLIPLQDPGILIDIDSRDDLRN